MSLTQQEDTNPELTGLHIQRAVALIGVILDVLFP